MLEAALFAGVVRDRSRSLTDILDKQFPLNLDLTNTGLIEAVDESVWSFMRL